MARSVFKKRIDNLPSSVWNKVSRIKELKGQWISGAQLAPQILGRLKKSALITSTGASTRIEGSKLSDADVEKLMRGISLQKFTERDKAEVQGYYELLNNVFDHWRTVAFSENTIKHFHKELLKYVAKDERHRGDYKTSENSVAATDSSGNTIATIFTTTPAYLTAKEMQELIEWTVDSLNDKAIEPLLVIGNFVVEFLKIHPFQDGNGRLSRILTNVLLLKNGYEYTPYVSQEKLIEDNKTDYYIALRQTQKTFGSTEEDITPWLTFFFDILISQAEKAISLLQQENIEKLLSPLQLKVWHYIKTVPEATPREISENTGVQRPTINKVLEKLIEVKLIQRLGLGRSTRYTVL